MTPCAIRGESMDSYEQVRKQLCRLCSPTTCDDATPSLLKGFCEHASYEPNKGELRCTGTGLAFLVRLPDLAEKITNYDARACLDNLRQSLDCHPNVREFAYYVPVLLGCIDTHQDDWERDATIRLRLATLFLQALDGREEYTDARALLLRQRFLLLTALRSPARVRDPSGQVRGAQRAWARLFLESPEETALLLDRYGGLDVEEEARWLVWRCGDPGQGLWRWACETGSDGAFSQYVARRWFLQRHELVAAGRLVGALAQATSERCLWRALSRGFFAFGRVWAYPLFPAGLLFIALALARWTATPARWTEGLAWTSVALALLSLLAITGALCAWGPMALYPFAVRLAAGVVVGLIAWAAMPQEMHSFAFSAFEGKNGGWAAVIILAALLSSLAYLFIETYNVVEHVGRAFSRALRVLCLGCAQALMLTTAWTAVGADRLVELPKEGSSAAFGLGGIDLHIDYVLFAAALVLAVGVFVQILWEDRPVTEPL